MSKFRTVRDEAVEGASQCSTWQRPAPRYGAGGRRLYVCPVCEDMGRVTLPRSKADETDAELLTVGGARGRYSYICPSCRLDELRTRMRQVGAADDAPSWWAEAQVDRLLRWLSLRRAQIASSRERYAEDVDERELVREAVAAVAKGME